MSLESFNESIIAMLSKIDRFKQWRGSQSDAEQNVLATALLISDYVSSVDNLDIIRDNAARKSKDFELHKARSLGTVVFAKLFIDEAHAQLPETAEKEKKILSNFSMILSKLYEDWKDNTKEHVFTLIGNIEKLLALNTVPFTDKNDYKTFMLSAYMLLLLIKIAIAKVDWKVQLAVSVFFNLEEIKSKIELFLQKIEEKMERFNHPKAERVVDPLKPIKELLNRRYHSVLGIGPRKSAKTDKLPELKRQTVPPAEKKQVTRSIFDSLTELEADIEKVSSGMFSLIELRKKKAGFDEKIEKVTQLLTAIDENDKKIIGRKDFLELLNGHQESYETLLNNTEAPQRQQLLEKVAQLKSSLASPNLSSGAIQGVSWVATPITIVYRTATPQLVQEAIGSTLPTTLDGACKMELKALINACLQDLQGKSKKKEVQTAAIKNRFFSHEVKLKQWIEEESLEQLIALKKANDAMKDAVQASCKLLTTIKRNSLFLYTLQQYSETLGEFVRLHDGWFVRVCNFLANFLSFFKTETAQMIDDAGVLKTKVDRLADEYQRAVAQGIRQIERTPNLTDPIKSYIKSQLKVELQDTTQEQHEYMNPNKRTVRLLMSSLSTLFAKKPQPHREQRNKKEHEEEQSTLIVASI